MCRSKVFLEEAGEASRQMQRQNRERGATLIARRGTLSAHAEMKKAMAAGARRSEKQIGIKATTNEEKWGPRTRGSIARWRWPASIMPE